MIEFTHNELMTMSSGIIVLIENAISAKKLISDDKTHAAIDLHIKKLRQLNNKICAISSCDNNVACHKYKINDKIKIRSDLKEGDIINGSTITKEMTRFRGKEAVIMSYNDDNEGGYLLDIDDMYWTWQDEMFF